MKSEYQVVFSQSINVFMMFLCFSLKILGKSRVGGNKHRNVMYLMNSAQALYRFSNNNLKN